MGRIFHSYIISQPSLFAIYSFETLYLYTNDHFISQYPSEMVLHLLSLEQKHHL
jgi:hypothetical protein